MWGKQREFPSSEKDIGFKGKRDKRIVSLPSKVLPRKVISKMKTEQRPVNNKYTVAQIVLQRNTATVLDCPQTHLILYWGSLPFLSYVYFFLCHSGIKLYCLHTGSFPIPWINNSTVFCFFFF
jgi:hypothetical protein